MNFVGTMQRWMDSKAGQTFLNYAYSWGASIVILGALFKLTHMTGADLMLFLGMGTEVIVFFLSAFDRPFEDDEATATQGAAVAGVIGGGVVMGGDAEVADAELSPATIDLSETPTTQGVGIVVGGGGGATIIGGGVIGGTGTIGSNVADTDTTGENTASGAVVIGGGVVGSMPAAVGQEVGSMAQDMEAASKEYVEKLQLLTETLERVEKQAARLTTDSEEMTNLNRTLTGINTVYELQLKSISQQVGTIDTINEQTRRMAQQIEELNGVYARMIKALTINMKNAAAPMSE